MRYIIYGTTCFLLCIFFLQLFLCVDARSARADELTQGVRTAMKSTLTAVMDERLEDEGEMKEYFQNRLEELITSQSELQVRFLDARRQEGLLSVQVVETFRYPFGKKGVLEEKQTAVIDQTIQEE